MQGKIGSRSEAAADQVMQAECGIWRFARVQEWRRSGIERTVPCSALSSYQLHPILPLSRTNLLITCSK